MNTEYVEKITECYLTLQKIDEQLKNLLIPLSEKRDAKQALEMSRTRCIEARLWITEALAEVS